MLTIDASAYPHIVEAILTEPVAWRAAHSLNREWRDVIGAAMCVVTVDCINSEVNDEVNNEVNDEAGCGNFLSIKTLISLTTTPTPRLPQRTLDIDQALAIHLGRLPPIRHLCVKYTNQEPGDSYPDFFFQLVGKVHTTRLLYSFYRWTWPCTTLMNDNGLLPRMPVSLRKFVIVQRVSTPYDFRLQTLPRSVSEITLSFHNWRRHTYHLPNDMMEREFCQPLAEPLICGRTINIVDLLGMNYKKERAWWFVTKVRNEVEDNLRDVGLLTNKHVDEVMSRLKFFDIGEYRQLNPDEI